MMGILQNKWFLLGCMALVTGTGGLVMGKLREKDYISSLYERRDFTLLDDKNEFFHLNSLPEKTLALLVFTPDGIPVDTVKPMFEFGRHLDDFRKQGVEPLLVSRTNREIARNFKRAARFEARMLVDIGGFVGQNAGIWEGAAPVAYWGYALVDRNFRVYWKGVAEAPAAFEDIWAEVKKAKPF